MFARRLPRCPPLTVHLFYQCLYSDTGNQPRISSYSPPGLRAFTATVCTAASRCVEKPHYLAPHSVKKNPVHVISTDTSENEINLSRLNIH